MQNLQVEYIEVSKLKPYKNNARKHQKEDVEFIKNSIQQFGMNDPIGIWGKDNLIVEGHGRLLAVKELGFDKVPCIRLDNLTDEQRRAYAIAHNSTAERSEWDADLLNLEIEELDFDFEDFGLDLEGLEIEEEKEVKEDEVPEVDEEAEPTVKMGQVWQLGRHRLMCGDSTKESDVSRLMNGVKADMVFTDPPYNVAFNGRSGKFEVIKNDDLQEKDFEKFIASVIKQIKNLSIETYYIWCNWKFYSVLQKNLQFKACIVWAKNVFGLGNGYRHQHEFCLFNGNIDKEIKNETDLWEIKKDTQYVHPTQKPIELCARALKNHRKLKTILDLFGGSGSTLIACEQLDRTCYTMELDPKYCDVIIKRYEQLTGDKARLLNE